MSYWVPVAGKLRNISVGSWGNVWGIDARGIAFRYSGYDAKPWVEVPFGKKLNDISAARDGTVWAGGTGFAVRFDWDQEKWVDGETSGLEKCDVVSISAGSESSVWCTSSLELAYRLSADKKWERAEMQTASWISAAGDGTVWKVYLGKPHRRTGKDEDWPQFGSVALSRIVVGSRMNVWGLEQHRGTAMRYLGLQKHAQWVEIPDPQTARREGLDLRFVGIGAAEDGSVWAVDDTDTVFRYEGDRSATLFSGPAYWRPPSL